MAREVVQNHGTRVVRTWRKNTTRVLFVKRIRIRARGINAESSVEVRLIDRRVVEVGVGSCREVARQVVEENRKPVGDLRRIIADFVGEGNRMMPT